MSTPEPQSNYQNEMVKEIKEYTPLSNLDRQGLGIYQRNLMAAGLRSLSISYPTITLLVGLEYMSQLAEQYVLFCPKKTFDWGAWGWGFPDWLAAQSIADEHPYLVDCARIDWAVHMSARSEDHHADFTSLNLLEKDLSQVFFVFSPSYILLKSGFPTVDIINAHKANPEAPNLSQAKKKFENNQGQVALVSRSSWKPVVREVEREELFWFSLKGTGVSLEAALNQLNEGDQALDVWLPKALGDGVVTGFEMRGGG